MKMKGKIDCELYSPSEENKFEEFSFFPAEDYKIPELKNDSKEDFKADELFQGEEPTKQEEKKITNFDKFKDKIISHSSTIVSTTAVAIASASIIGIIPDIIGDNNKNSFGTVITNSLVDNSSFYQISIDGDMEISNDVSRYYALVKEFGNDNKEEEFYAELSLNNKHFVFNADVFYGIESYSYTIIALNEKEEENVVYSSSLTPFTFDQSYQATYQKLKPTESKITFSDNDFYQVEIDTGFQTTYPNIFQYEVSAITREGNVLDKYVGTDSIVTLQVPYGENLYLMYKDISYFADEEIVSEQYMSSNYSVVTLPNLNFDSEFGFNGQNFTLSYNFNTTYVFSSFSLYLYLDNGKGIKRKIVQNLEKFGIIVLDDYEGEIGDLSLTGELEFQDDLLDSYLHKIPIADKYYEMSYKLDVTSLIANLTGAITDSIPLSFEFDYLLPNDYMIGIYNQDRTIDEKITLRDFYYLNKVSSINGGVITIAILAPDGSEFKKVSDYTIYSVDEIKSTYTTPTISNSTNPGDSVVTYNEDNTVNIYRNVGFSSTDPNIYLDTLIYETVYEDPSTGEIRYLNAVHSRTLGKYSIMENLTPLDYLFYYIINYDKDGVTYQMYKEEPPPSGNLYLSNRQPIRYEVNYDETNDYTKLIIYNDLYYYIKNQIIIDNIYYYFTEYIENVNSYQAHIPGNILGKQMNLSMTLYDKFYDSYSIDCEMKGDRYKTYTFDINI